MTQRRYVYLAGPIMYCDRAEANDWRYEVAAQLEAGGMIGISPLRCEPLIGERYTMEYTDPLYGTARAIASKNKADIQMCDIGIYYIPEPETISSVDLDTWVPGETEENLLRRPYSHGTIGEMFWADAFNKPTILVTDSDHIKSHPVIGAAAGWIVDNFEDAVELCISVVGAYGPGGKNV